MNSDFHVPGQWACPLCGFRLSKNIMAMAKGKILADSSPLNSVCPNDGQLMHPLTWKSYAEELAAGTDTLIQRCIDVQGILEGMPHWDKIRTDHPLLQAAHGLRAKYEQECAKTSVATIKPEQCPHCWRRIFVIEPDAPMALSTEDLTKCHSCRTPLSRNCPDCERRLAS